MTHAARVAAGRAGTEGGLALDQHHVPDATTREVVRHARAHTAAADDDDVRRLHLPRTTTLRSTPTPSTSISTTSPAAMARVVCGVPVKMTSPGSSVM